MKLEIDLDDILGDEFGTETLAESVRRQVVESAKECINKKVGEKIDIAVSGLLQDEIKEVISSKMPVLMDQLLDYEYVPVTRYGSIDKEPTTFRKELIKSITENMVYKKPVYASDRNEFTKTVDSVIENQLNAFKSEFLKLVDDKFKVQALNYAVDTLKKKLGIS